MVFTGFRCAHGAGEGVVPPAMHGLLTDLVLATTHTVAGGAGLSLLAHAGKITIAGTRQADSLHAAVALDALSVHRWHHPGTSSVIVTGGSQVHTSHGIKTLKG
jgi:hypothetical protein